jgi:hypothetical protein
MEKSVCLREALKPIFLLPGYGRHYGVRVASDGIDFRDQFDSKSCIAAHCCSIELASTRTRQRGRITASGTRLCAITGRQRAARFAPLPRH